MKGSNVNFGNAAMLWLCMAVLPGLVFTIGQGVPRAEEATMDQATKSNIFNDVVHRMFTGQKVTPAEFGEFIQAQNDGAHSGLNVGEKIPAFELPDQSGNRKSFGDLAGPDGLLLVFSRSADW
jgi:hypothetical protein